MQRKDILFWLWLAHTLGAANHDFRKLIVLYDNPYDLFHAEDSELERIPEITPRTRKKLGDKDLSRATRILDACEKLGIGVLPYGDEEYPASLRELQDPPIVLYYSGTLPSFQSQLFLGMVGTRSMSAYGLRQAYKISFELASVGAVIVSGMAKGIDGVAAAAALSAKGSTVAVLGCGLDIVYPLHHKNLMDAIRQNGVLISEYPPGTKPNHYHFPVRNRIISGLSQGTVVVEAGLKSGSLITAKAAIMQGRDVFALPSNVGSEGGKGTIGLIKDGANAIADTADILERYQYVYAKALRMEALPKAMKNSGADLAHLDRMGVIQWNGNAEKRERITPKTPDRTERSVRDTAKRAKSTEHTDVFRRQEKNGEGEKPLSPVSAAVLESLTPAQLAILSAIPDDRAVSTDALSGLGYPYGEIIAALTMLEITGLIQKLPGALYTKL